MSAKSQSQVDESNKDLGEVLHSVILKCEKELQSVITNNLRMSTKSHVMHSLLRTKILLARFLVLYRWVKKSESAKNYKDKKILFEENTEKAKKKYRQIRAIFQNSNNFNTREFIPQIEQIEEIFFNPDPRTIFLCLMQQKIPTEITNISLQENIIYVSSSNIYSYALKIKDNGKLTLKSFHLLFPMSENSIQTITLMIQNCVFTSQSIFFDLNQLLYRLYTIGQYILLCERLKNYQTLFGYKIIKTENSSLIVFGSSMDYRVEYKVSPTECGISIFSLKMHEKQDKTKSFFKVLFANSQIDLVPILSEMRDISHHSIMIQITNRLSHAFTAAGLPSFKCEFTGNRIYVKANQLEFCSVYLSRFDSEIHADIFEELGVTGPELVHCLSCDECERVSISHSLYLVSAIKDMLNLVGIRSHNIPVRSSQPRAIRFSFSEDFYIRFTDQRGKPRLEVVSNDGVVTSTNEMTVLNESNHLCITEKRISNAILSAKAAIVILQLQKSLMKDGIESRAENNKIHFSISPFECVEFRCNYNGYWTLFFVKPLPLYDDATICIHGNSFNANFGLWLKQLISIIGSDLTYISQLESISVMQSLITKFSVENKLDFSIQFTNTSKKVNIRFRNMQFIERKANVEHFKVKGIRFPTLSFDPLESKFEIFTPNLKFESIMALVPSITLVYKYFRDRPNWFIQFSEKNRNIMLIYKMRYTILFNPLSSVKIDSAPNSVITAAVLRYSQLRNITETHIRCLRDEIEMFVQIIDFLQDEMGFTVREIVKPEYNAKGQMVKEILLVFNDMQYGDVTVSISYGMHGPHIAFTGDSERSKIVAESCMSFIRLINDKFNMKLFRDVLTSLAGDYSLASDIVQYLPEILRMNGIMLEKSIATFDFKKRTMTIFLEEASLDVQMANHNKLVVTGETGKLPDVYSFKRLCEYLKKVNL